MSRRHLRRSGPVGVELKEVVAFCRCQNAGNCTRRRKGARRIWPTGKTSGVRTLTASASGLEDRLRRSIDQTSCGAVTPTASSVTVLARGEPR